MNKKQKTKTKSPKKTRVIHVDTLARVEGEGALYVKMHGDKVQDVQLKIFEPPRFFESFLRGRAYSEAPDITARICGICPIAYQMSAVHAVENALASPSTRPYASCAGSSTAENGSRATRFTSTCSMRPTSWVTRTRSEWPKTILRMSSAACGSRNPATRSSSCLAAARFIPINVKVGGFYKLPSKADAAALCERLK